MFGMKHLISKSNILKKYFDVITCLLIKNYSTNLGNNYTYNRFYKNIKMHTVLYMY